MVSRLICAHILVKSLEDVDFVAVLLVILQNYNFISYHNLNKHNIMVFNDLLINVNYVAKYWSEEEISKDISASRHQSI